MLGAGRGEARHRLDGNEPETSGLSMRMGSVGLRHELPRLAEVRLAARARRLAAHSEEGAEESGVSVTARLGPGAHGRGLSLSLSPRWGAGTGEPLGGTSALWREELPKGAPGAGAPETGALDLRVGYGFGHFGGRFTGTPNLGFGTSDGGGREVRVGWRLTPAVRGYAGFEVNVDATRREAANGNEPPAHGGMLTGAIRW